MNPPTFAPLEAPDQTLPVATVGVKYEEMLTINGGQGPYEWTVPSWSEVPGGLKLKKDGRIKGTPSQAGDHIFSVIAHDSVGREKQIQITLTVLLELDVVQCGDTISGEFKGSGFGATDVDFGDTKNVKWLGVQVPDDLTTRIELKFTNNNISTVYVQRPSEPVGSWDLEEHYVGAYLNPGFTPMVFTLDASTDPSLSGYSAQPTIPLLLVGQAAGNWSLTVECTDGPILVRAEQYPTQRGDPLEIDYDVYGDNTDVRIYTEDPLPPWMIWDEDTGTVTGTAMEEGGWEFTVIAETEDGRRREERSIIGVYEVQPIACDEPTDFMTTEGYYDGEFNTYWDPKGWKVFRLDLETIVPGALHLNLTGSEGHYLGTAMPAPDWLRFYGGAERAYESAVDAELTIDPRTYPAVGHYVDDAQLYFVAGSLGIDQTMRMTVDCDMTARPDLAGLPVVQPLESTDFSLDAIGGVAPYTWSADKLPNGLTLSTDGVIEGSSGAIGTTDIGITVLDKFGQGSTESFPMYVGFDEACKGYTQIACDESVDGHFSTSYFSDGDGDGSTVTFCLVPDEQLALGFELYADDTEVRVDIADPGASAEDMFDFEKGTLVSFVTRYSAEGIAINPWSWPNLDDYRDLPLLVAVRGFEAGDWTMHLTCD